jgi:MarR family transcriptional regulator, organic hydroperoxide resistance regulator
MATMSKIKRVELVRSLVGEIRQFIAGAILYNQMLAEQLGIHSTDQQLMNFVELLDHTPPEASQETRRRTKQGARPGDLARLSGLTTGGVTVALDRLEKAGFVHRERNPDDRRSVIIRMNPEGRRKVLAQYQSVNEVMDKVFSAYGDKELKLICDFFSATNEARLKSNRMAKGK